MGAESSCRACGGIIEITAEGTLDDAVARGDQFFHRGCIEAHPPQPGPTGPAYFIPRSW